MGNDWRDPPRRPRSPADTRGESCCPMVAAVRAVSRGRLRLACRYAAMSVRLLVGEGGVVRVVAVVGDPKRCVPRAVSWGWFFNRRPRGR